MIHRVVLVDDVDEIRQILRLILEQSGWFEVVGEAADGIEGVAVVAETKPDIVLLDVEMPGPDGWAVLPRMKEVAPNVAVVVLSGTIGDQPISIPNDARDLADAVLKKGIATGDLIDALLAVAPRRPVPNLAQADVSHPGEKPPPGGAPRIAPTIHAPANTNPANASINPEQWAARLGTLIEASPDAIIGTDTDGRIVSWNPAAERIFGLTDEEAIGRDVATLVPPDRADEPARIRERFAAGAVVQHVETVALRKDGSRVEIAVTVSPVNNPEGELAGFASIARDITGRREADAALARAVAQLETQNRELRRSNEELDSFASVASHDLAQPLQVAYGYLEMLRSEFGDGLDPKAATWLDASVRSLDRMRRLVQDILRYARTGAQHDRPPEPVDLDEALGHALDGLTELLDERGAEVEVVGGPLPTVEGHEGQLISLLQNLVGNAIKFVPEGETPHVRVMADGNTLRVVDNGPGVPADQRDRIFDMFQRNHGQEVAGSGLGLTICKKIVQRHRGRIWIEDGPDGRGAAFCVQLP